MLDEIVHHRLMLTGVSYNAAIISCEKNQKWEKCYGLLGDMLHIPLAFALVNCNAATSGFEKC